MARARFRVGITRDNLGPNGKPIFAESAFKILQDAIVRAGKEAGAYGRKLESSEDQARLQRLEKECKLKTFVFADRDQLLKLAEPVKQMYAKEVGAEDVLTRINAIK
jgi:TRAP-type C4-dicarboxylate transport system substrate-binding protein